MDKLEVTTEHAAQYRRWIAGRGGLLVWRSINLSNPGASWTTPYLTEAGVPYTKPTWQAANEPERHITTEEDVVVQVPKEVKRFHIGVQSGDGLSFKVTDGGSRRIRRELAKAGTGSWYEFDYEMQEAVISIADQTIPLTEWKEEVANESNQENVSR